MISQISGSSFDVNDVVLSEIERGPECYSAKPKFIG